MKPNKLLTRLFGYIYRENRKRFKEIQSWKYLAEKLGFWDIEYYLSQFDRTSVLRGWEAWDHFVWLGAWEGKKPIADFDTAFYLSAYPDVANNPINPLVHYILIGEKQGRKPNPRFDPVQYLEANADVKEASISPLHHYIHQGKKEGRPTSPNEYIRHIDCNSEKLTGINSYVQSDFYEEESKDIGDEKNSDVKIIAYYLPQYHPIKENDKWWGKGFTEWRNVSQGTPQYINHYQPHIPADLGFYDLRLKEVMAEQIHMARRHGVHGFCFYHYWFAGKRIMDMPVNMLLDNPDLDMPFCLCWANENWTRTWDGLEQDILLEQNHSPEDDIAFIQDISRYLKDDRYIKINGKPLVIVYRASLFPDMSSTLERWRKWLDSNGVGDVFFAMVQFDDLDPRDYGFDAAVEFPPHIVSQGTTIDYKMSGQDSNFCGGLYDYNRMVSNSLLKIDEGYKVFRAVTLGWDNTARRRERGHSFVHYNPKKYEAWLSHLLNEADKEDDKFVFVNAWNEWAEGVHLEPDIASGFAALNATSRAVDNVGKEKQKLALSAHIFYEDLVDEIISYAQNLPSGTDIFITAAEDAYEAVVEKFNLAFPESMVLVNQVPNRGRDIAPFLLNHVEHYGRYDYICKIHSKKSLHAGGINNWRGFLYDHLLGSKKQVQKILERFNQKPDLGLVFPEYSDDIKPHINWGSNFKITKKFLKTFNIDITENTPLDLPAGSMFWFKPEALKQLFDFARAIDLDYFPAEDGQVDGTVMHAIERAFLFVVSDSGYDWSDIDFEQNIEKARQ